MASMAAAQDAKRPAAYAYPVRPVRLVVPFPPGGGNDTLTRAIAAQFSTSLGQPFVIDNRAGAGGTVGADIVATAAADGYTLLMGSSSLAVNASLLKNPPHDAIRDFAPVGMVGATAYLLAVHPALAVRSVADLITLAKAKPGQLKTGTAWWCRRVPRLVSLPCSTAS
jgi:tripartite-type tricarboxylate transporter receptor subunit TctC